MTAHLLRRLAASLLLLLLVLSLLFFLLHLAPGDPAQTVLDGRLTPEARDQLHRSWGLDRPLPSRYVRWLAALARGDWGTSFAYGVPVRRLLASHVPQTLLLAAAALLVQFGVALPLGIAAARREGRLPDHLIRIGSLLLVSLPLFWTGLMAVLLLSYRIPLFPAGHMTSVDADGLAAPERALDLIHHLALPALVLGLAAAGGTARFLRGSLLQVFGEDYIRTAHALGIGERRVLWVHALRNAASPVVQILGLSLPFLLSGSLVVEVVFSWPGLGRLTYGAILARDYPVVLASTGLTGALVIAGNWLADGLQALIDPRLRES